MPANHEPAELSLLETLAAAPAEAIAEGQVEAAALALYAHGALTAVDELEVCVAGDLPRCDALPQALFTAYDRGLVERSGSTWHLASGGRATLEEAGIEATAEARMILAEALDHPSAELLADVAETLSSRYAMIAAGDGQPVQV